VGHSQYDKTLRDDVHLGLSTAELVFWILMLCIDRGLAILNEVHSTRAIRKVTSGEM
jgi:hypothetical protein